MFKTQQTGGTLRGTIHSAMSFRHLLSTCVFFYLSASAPASGQLRVGAAAVPISPSAGTPMAGYYDVRAAQGVDDELFAKAIVIEQDGAKVAMVVCDLISMPRPVSEEARR